MQRLHMDDLAGTFIEQGWPALVLPAIAEQDETFDLGGDVFHTRKKGELLQEGRDSREELDAIKRDDGTHVFSAQWQQCPLPAEGNLVKRAHIKTYKDLPPREKFRHIYIACDPSGAMGVKNDNTAIVVAGVIERQVYVTDVQKGHWECLKIARKMKDLAERWKATRMIIETTGQGEAARQEIARDDRLYVQGITQKLDKVARLWQVAGRFEAGNLLLPSEAPWLADFERELFGFPIAKNDDQVDALIMILEDLRNREDAELACYKVDLSQCVIPRDPHLYDRFGNY